MTKTYLHIFPTFVPAGSQVRTVQLMAGLGSGIRHVVTGLDGRTDALELVPENIEALARPLEGGTGVRALRRHLAAVQPDLLLTYNWGSFDAVLAARWSGFRAHVHHEDGFNADEAHGQKRRRVWSRRLFLRSAQRLIVPSRNLERIARETWKLPEHVVQFVSNGVHLERFSPQPPTPDEGRAAVRARLGIPAEALVVGAVGHLRPVKNFARLFEACARLPQELAERGVHVLLLGDGPEREHLERVAESAVPPGGTVHFAGHQRELAPFYRAMDVLAISSDSEQQPVSLLEAMATGVPVAATDVGDVGVTLGSLGSPYLAPLGPEATGGLSQAIGRLLADDARRADLGTQLIERAQREYSFGAMLSTYRSIYEDACR